MAPKKKNNLKERILKEMTVDIEGALEKNFDKAKTIINTTKTGKVDIIDKESLTAEEKILAYFLGKKYAAIAELSDADEVDVGELMNELGLKKGTVDPAINALKKAKKIVPTRKAGKKLYHKLADNRIEEIINELTNKNKTAKKRKD